MTKEQLQQLEQQLQLTHESQRNHLHPTPENELDYSLDRDQFLERLIAMVEYLPRPNPFRSFLFDDCYIWVGADAKSFFKTIRRWTAASANDRMLAYQQQQQQQTPSLTEPKSVLWSFLEKHCRMDGSSHLVGRAIYGIECNNNNLQKKYYKSTNHHQQYNKSLMIEFSVPHALFKTFVDIYCKEHYHFVQYQKQLQHQHMRRRSDANDINQQRQQQQLLQQQQQEHKPNKHIPSSICFINQTVAT